MALSFPASPSDGDVYTNTTTGVKYIYNATDDVWKTQVFPTNTDYLQLTGGTLTGNLSLGTNDLTAQDINSTTLTTTGGVTVGNGLTVSAGNVVMSSGAGIDFSATADGSGTMTSELLADYEEGTWTPGVTVGTVTPFSAVYTRIGRVVRVSCTLSAFSDRTNTGHLIVTGLPFTPSGSGGSDVATGSAMGQYVNVNYSTTYTSSTGVYIYGMVAGAYGFIRYSNLTSTASTIYLNATYLLN